MNVVHMYGNPRDGGLVAKRRQMHMSDIRVAPGVILQHSLSAACLSESSLLSSVSSLPHPIWLG